MFSAHDALVHAEASAGGMEGDCFSGSWCWTALRRPEVWHFVKKPSLTYVLEQTSTDLPSLPRFLPHHSTEDTGHE